MDQEGNPFGAHNLDIGAIMGACPELDFVLHGFVAGTTGMLTNVSAPNGDEVAQQVATQIAYSVAGGDLLDVRPPETGGVGYFAFENHRVPGPVLNRQFKSIIESLSHEQWECIKDNFEIYMVDPLETNIMHDAFFEEAIQCCEGKRLVVLDSLSKAHRLDPNSNRDMMNLLNRLQEINHRTGATVLAIHDIRADNTDAPQVLRDHAHYEIGLHGMSEEEAERHDVGEQRERFVHYHIDKIRYDKHIPGRWYKRTEDGVLHPVELTNEGN